jgi:hypothetical protein
MLIYTLNAMIQNGFFIDEKTYIATPDFNAVKKAQSYLKSRNINATISKHLIKKGADREI